MKRRELRVPDTRHAKQLEPFGDNTPLSTTLAYIAILALHWPLSTTLDYTGLLVLHWSPSTTLANTLILALQWHTLSY